MYSPGAFLFCYIVSCDNIELKKVLIGKWNGEGLFQKTVNINKREDFMSALIDFSILFMIS